MPHSDMHRTGLSPKKKRWLNIENKINICRDKMSKSKPGKPLYEQKKEYAQRLLKKLPEDRREKFNLEFFGLEDEDESSD